MAEQNSNQRESSAQTRTKLAAALGGGVVLTTVTAAYILLHISLPRITRTVISE